MVFESCHYFHLGNNFPRFYYSADDTLAVEEAAAALAEDDQLEQNQQIQKLGRLAADLLGNQTVVGLDVDLETAAVEAGLQLLQTAVEPANEEEAEGQNIELLPD